MGETIKSHSPRDWTLNGCKNSTVVTSLEGLNYTLYCDYDLSLHELDASETDTPFECIDSCTKHAPACLGVTWLPLKRICSRKHYSVTISDLKISESPSLAALATASQYAQQRTSFVCPYSNLSIQKAKSGMRFQVLCGGSYVVQDSSVLARVHVQSLDECMERCANFHPLCSRITYGADLIGLGWLNCVILSANQDELVVASTKTMAHSAEVFNLQLPEKPSWKNGSTQMSSNKTPFKVSRNDLRDFNTAQSLPTYHHGTIQNCVDQCTRNATNCIAVAFDSSLQFGYLNCYLFDRFPPPKEWRGDFTFAYLESLSDQYQPPPPHRRTHLSAGAIAGISLGSIASVLFFGFAWLQMRKRIFKFKSG